jgi:ERCC4-related helicase
MVTTPLAIPEQGQLVRLRQRFWSVQDVTEHETDGQVSHHVLLECLDDDQLGTTLHVLWEREIAPSIFESGGLPQPMAWDSSETFDAFVTAIRWSGASLLEQEGIRAPFFAAIAIEEYQLEPIVRMLTIPRVNLLIADDVGLGKTIEAGLLMQEMLTRQRIRRVMILCPASLQKQWQEEMQEKFQLHFEIIDRQSIQQLRREYGMHINPWTSHPRLITSMDFLKREQPLRLFQQSLQHQDSPLRDWDLLIVDEAHNVAPSGRGSYAVDSDRTRMMRRIADHFEHRLFLTATPHNGYTESFTALLELLDPLRFSRGPDVDLAQVQQVMVRRLKADVMQAMSRRKFAQRAVKALEVQPTEQESQLFERLNAYAESRLERLEWSRSLPVRFALTMLKKRLLSSPKAFARSIHTHMQSLGATDEMADMTLLGRMTERVQEDWANDDEKNQAEDDALVESSRFFTDLLPEERDHLQHMVRLLGDVPDTKLAILFDWIEEHLRENGAWTDERLVLFTEYKDTLHYLQEVLSERYGAEALLTLYGGMMSAQREAIKAAFMTPPAEHPVRILVATDAASEGLNLQAHCRYLMHYEIPWNPNRMEQRNGRIDRHGQTADVVEVYHFLYTDNADSRFLQTVIDKVQTMQADLGSVGEIIAQQVERAMLGQGYKLNVPDERRKLAQDVVRGELVTEDKIRQVRRQMDRTRHALSVRPETMAQVLDAALQILGHDGLQAAMSPTLRDRAYNLQKLPQQWHSLADTLRDADGRWRDITFDHHLAEGRHDLTLLHLNHPLLRQALGVFRARLWSEPGEGGLNRVSYRILPQITQPVVIAYGRLVAIGNTSQRLHESILTVGGEFQDDKLYPLPSADIERMLSERYEMPDIPTRLGTQLRRTFKAHERQLLQRLEEAEASERERLTQLASERAEADAKAVQELIQTRIEELRTRLRRDEKQRAASPYQLELFDRDEYLQYQEDLRWLAQKLEALQARSKEEPARVRQMYALRSVRVLPMALLYLLPEYLLEA